MEERPGSAQVATKVRGVRPDFLRKFFAVLLLGLVFVFAAVGQAGFDQPDWVFLEPVEAESNADFRLLRDYVRLDTTNPPGNEVLGTRWLAEVLRRNGIESEEICPVEGRCNLVARIDGVLPRGGLLLVHHIDVWPTTEGFWPAPPFAGEIVKGDLVGRGTIDDKSMGIAHLRAFLEVARSGKRPLRSLVFLADADEESPDQQLGLRWLIPNRPDLFRGVDYALGEGGVNETLAGQVAYWGIEIGHPAFLEYTLESEDPEAVEELAKRMADRVSPWEITPAARLFLERIAYERKAPWRERVRDLDAALRDPAYLRLFPAGYIELLRTVIHDSGETVIEGGLAKRRVVAGVPVDVDPAPHDAWIREQVTATGGRVRIAKTRHQPKSVSASWDSPLTGAIIGRLREMHPEIPAGPYLLPATSTTSKYLRAAGITAYGWSPFRITILQAYGIHGAAERLNIGAFFEGVSTTGAVVGEFLFAPPTADEQRHWANSKGF